MTRHYLQTKVLRIVSLIALMLLMNIAFLGTAYGEASSEISVDGTEASNDNAETSPDIENVKNWVEVKDPYIELHTGPGAGYPIFFVVEKGGSVEILKEKTSWFKVLTKNGESGWVNRDQMGNTLRLTGEKFVVTDVGEDEFGGRIFEAGVAVGDFSGARLTSIDLGFRFASNLSAEVSLSQVNGNFSNSQFLSAGIVNQPFTNWRVSPLFYLGYGVIETTPKTTLVQSKNSTNQLVTVGLGVKIYLTERFIWRVDYRQHVVLTNRSDNEIVNEWKTGFSVFF